MQVAPAWEGCVSQHRGLLPSVPLELAHGQAGSRGIGTDCFWLGAAVLLRRQGGRAGMLAEKGEVAVCLAAAPSASPDSSRLLPSCVLSTPHNAAPLLSFPGLH